MRPGCHRRAGHGAAGTGTGGGGTGGAAGAGGSGGDPGWTLANVCEKLPPLICADREQCCVQAFGFDKANCQANEKNDCEAQVKLVQANQATFHPENIDACLQAVKPLLGACFFQGDLYASLLKTSNLCRSIFDGMKTPGTQCSEDTECQTAPGPNGYSGCGSQSQQCYQGSVKQQGEGCDNNTICEQGLSCKFSGGSNNCQPAAQPGAGCFQSSDCALGYYCAGGKCTTAKPAGESCFNFQHCQSLSCSGGKCGEQRPYVNQAGCGK